MTRKLGEARCILIQGWQTCEENDQLIFKDMHK